MRHCRGRTFDQRHTGSSGEYDFYNEEFVVHIVKLLPTTICFTCHVPRLFPSYPFTELNVLFMFRLIRVRWIIARPSGTSSLRFPTIFLYSSYFMKIVRKLDFSARVAPRIHDARVAPEKYELCERFQAGSPIASPAWGSSFLLELILPVL